MNDQELLRYSRHILLNEVGVDGQQRLREASMLVIGAGGLGSPAAFYLASAGVARITLVDGDQVDLTNLQRQILHTTARIGTPKAVSGQVALAAINDDVEIIPVASRADEEALMTLVDSATVVLDCSDNFATRHALNRACVAHRKPLVSGAAIRFDGQVAVFDLRGASRIGTLARQEPRRARELAAAAYELGLAFALGKPVVVLASAQETLPFDVDLSPVGLEGDDLDAEVMAQAVDEAFYVPQRPGRSSSIGATLAELDRLTAEHPRRAALEGMGWLAPGLASDPAGFAAAAEHVLDALPHPRPRLLRPSWPGCYPEPARRMCFHVMPFGPAWADAVRDAAQAACADRGLFYRRGDEADEGRIIHAIWQDICRAETVLVDLTGANLNVMIELGLAHAIGRPVLAVQGPDEPDIRPRHIEKLRVLPYDSPQGLRELLSRRLGGR